MTVTSQAIQQRKTTPMARTQLRGSAALPVTRRWLLPSFFVCFALVASSCSHKGIKPGQVDGVVQTLEDQAGKIKTCRGRAWISINAGEGKASFSGVIVIDRTLSTRPQLRIEALDPFGTLHHLIVIQHNGPQSLRLLWLDFDNKTVREALNSWKGMPLALFPNLLLGTVPPSSLGWGPLVAGKAVSVGDDDDHFRVNFEKAEGDVVVTRSLDYFVTWIPPGARLALRRMQTVLPDSPQAVVVDYSHFRDKKDFYSPEEVVLESQRLSVKLSWREQSWNDVVDSSLFQVSQERLKGFVRERQ